MGNATSSHNLIALMYVFCLLAACSSSVGEDNASARRSSGAPENRPEVKFFGSEGSSNRIPVEIHVVSTVGELQMQPSMQLDGSGEVRLGVSSCHVPIGGHALLYCLWASTGLLPETYTLPPLGPLMVRWQGDGVDMISATLPSELRKPSAALALYSVSLPATSLGPRTVEVLNDAYVVVASATIEGMKDARPALFPLDVGTRSASRFLECAVTEGQSGIQEQVLPTNADKGLPRLSPSVDAHLVIQQDGSELVVSSSRQIRVSPLSRFAFRLWIDGDALGYTESELLGTSGGLQEDGNEVRVPAEFTERLLKRYPHQHLKIQLLYCEHGFVYHEAIGAAPQRGENFVLESNVLTLVEQH